MPRCKKIHQNKSPLRELIGTHSEIITYLERELSPKRLEHTYSVADECRKLAPQYGLSETQTDELYTAALLHDITKEKPLEFHLRVLQKYNISLPEDELESVPALHARTGALIAKELFRINSNVFSAIDSHTTGSDNMSVCDKLLFLCDFIEPKRRHDACVALRRYYFGLLESLSPVQALDKAVLHAMDSTVCHLIDEQRTVALRTVSARNNILKIINGKDTP